MLQVVPNSHFWTNLEMLKNNIQCYNNQFDGVSLKDYLVVGIGNTLKHGYDLRKRVNKHIKGKK